MHDVKTLDLRGVAGCAVASSEFKAAAKAQSRSLGFEPALVWVDHPVQNRTAEELADMARKTISQILNFISDTPSNK